MTALSFIIAPLAADAQPTPCPNATTLEEIVQCLVGRMPGKDTNGFILPTATEMDDWESVVEAMLDGGCELIALPASLSGLYEISEFTDADNSEDYCILVELADAGDADKKGWGTFITNPFPLRELAIQVPHPLFEQDTPAEGIGVFKATGARSFLIAGAHRRANEAHACQHTSSNDYRTSDVNHHHETMFQPTTRGLLDWYVAEGLRDDLVVLQFHGMTSCPGVDVYTTYGRPPGSGTPQTGDALLDLQTNLTTENPSWTVVVPGGTPSCSHNGSLNLQGRLLNYTGTGTPDFCSTHAPSYTGNFIHVEQKPGQFRDPANWADAIATTWP